MKPPPAIAILDSPEVTQRILEAIIDSPNGRRGLSRLARTCHAWTDPALNVLWRELDSLAPIIGLFPPHLLKKSRRPGLGLTTLPLEGDWKKILKYGGKVSKITYDEIANNVSSSIFPIFEEHRPRTYLLPNLRHLTWKVMSPDNLDYASLFLTAELQGLVLHLNGSGTKFPSLPKLLADNCSRMKLQSFAINSTVALPDAFTELMLPQDTLEKLVVVAPGALSPALDLSNRSMIAINGFFDKLHSGNSTPASVESHTDSGVFSDDEAVDFTDIRKSLLRLTEDANAAATHRPGQSHTKDVLIYSDSHQVSNIAAFLAHLSSPLTQLELVIEDPPDAADWRDLFSSLMVLRIGATLSSKFGDLVRSTSRATPAPSRLSLEHLGPLPELVRFSVDLPESVVFTASDVTHLAKMCPNLEEVRLCPLARFSAASPPQLTLEALAPLMRDCRRLNTLAVVINAKGGVAETSASSNSLLWLHVGHSWVTDTLQVAILLSHFAPRLEAVKWYTERNRPGFVEANARGWQRVIDALPHLQNVRLTERKALSPQKEIVLEYVYVEAPRPQVSDKAIDATVRTTDRGVEAKPPTVERSIHATPSLSNREVQASPEHVSVGVDAAEPVVRPSPTLSNREVQASPEHASIGIDASPPAEPAHPSPTVAVADEDVSDPPSLPSAMSCDRSPSVLSPSILSLFAFVCRVFISYPLSIPLRMFQALTSFTRTTSRPGMDQDVALDTLNYFILCWHHNRTMK
ncbi:hypothetical protein C8J57DRAFT_1268076 [Mycena rebaudengoi]|nr:hypothetical protein C8J57DRAFT_1268076 [Mycena rebaudengoi]